MSKFSHLVMLNVASLVLVDLTTAQAQTQQLPAKNITPSSVVAGDWRAFIKAAARHNEDMLPTIRAHWSVKYTYHDAFRQANPEAWENAQTAKLTLAQEEGTCVRDSTGRYRLERGERYTSGRFKESLCGFDGTEFKFYDSMPQEPAYGRRGRVSAKTQEIPMLSPDRFAAYDIDVMRLSKYLDKSMMKEAREVADRSGRKLLELDTVHFADANIMVRFRFDPERGYCVRAIETYMLKPNHLAISIETTQFKEARAGVWYPVEGVMKSFQWMEKQGRALEAVTYDLKVTSVEAGIELKDDAFRIDFPPGTRVLNEIVGGTYLD